MSLPDHLAEQTKTNMYSNVFNCSGAAWRYRRHLDSCEIIDNCDSSDSNDISDKRQEQTRLQDFAKVCINNRQYSGLSGRGYSTLALLDLFTQSQ